MLGDISLQDIRITLSSICKYGAISAVEGTEKFSEWPIRYSKEDTNGWSFCQILVCGSGQNNF